MSRRKRSLTTLHVEGVPYDRYVVRFRLADGRWRRWVRWSPGPNWVYDEVGRELIDRFDVGGVRERSVTIRHEPLAKVPTR